MDAQEQVKKIRDARTRINQEIGKVIVGQEEIVEGLLIALFSRGHSILIGVPGLAKTLMINTLARMIDLKFKRIQFTPDLMPTDIIGTEVIQEEQGTGKRIFRFVKGPIFANIVLADEINRTPPKTQAALLQAMQEYAVTAGGETYPLEPPFFVLATQNPIEQEGTYPLPEAQLDRFMFSLYMTYPKFEEEVSIVRLTTSARQEEASRVMSGREILEIQDLVRQVPVSEHVTRYAVQISASTRPHQAGSRDFINRWISWGAGPRAAQYLILGAKARAVLHGRPAASCGDVRAVAHPVLRHRLVTNYNAIADGVTTKEIVDRILEAVPEPSGT